MKVLRLTKNKRGDPGNIQVILTTEEAWEVVCNLTGSSIEHTLNETTEALLAGLEGATASGPVKDATTTKEQAHG